MSIRFTNTYSLIQKAVSIRSMVDYKGKMGEPEAQKYLDFLKNEIENPTGFLIIKSNFFNKDKVNFPGAYVRNMRKLKYNPDIKELQTKFDKLINDNYPKTKFARKYIIKTNRLSPYYTTQTRGYNFVAKMKIFTNILHTKIFRTKFKI